MPTPEDWYYLGSYSGEKIGRDQVPAKVYDLVNRGYFRLDPVSESFSLVKIEITEAGRIVLDVQQRG